MQSTKLLTDVLPTSRQNLGIVPGKEESGRRRRCGWNIATIVTIILVLLGLRLHNATKCSSRIWDFRWKENGVEAVSIGDGKLGAVASESAVCSRHGADMLKIGGNAADAVSQYGSNLPVLQ